MEKRKEPKGDIIITYLALGHDCDLEWLRERQKEQWLLQLLEIDGVIYLERRSESK